MQNDAVVTAGVEQTTKDEMIGTLSVPSGPLQIADLRQCCDL